MMTKISTAKHVKVTQNVAQNDGQAQGPMKQPFSELKAALKINVTTAVVDKMGIPRVRMVKISDRGECTKSFSTSGHQFHDKLFYG